MVRCALLAIAVAITSIACGDKPAPTKTATSASKGPKIAAAEEKINKTTPDGKAMIEKVQAMKPEVNEQESSKTIKEMADEYAKDKGAYNIMPIGWEAYQKKPLPNEKTGRWKVVFHYQDWQKNTLAAEWEYNPETGKVYPFETTNAPGFWAAKDANQKGPPQKGKPASKRPS